MSANIKFYLVYYVKSPWNRIKIIKKWIQGTKCFYKFVIGSQMIAQKSDSNSECTVEIPYNEFN